MASASQVQVQTLRIMDENFSQDGTTDSNQESVLEIQQGYKNPTILSKMKGSIWEYSNNQPWFLLGLHKNNPSAQRIALESMVKLTPEQITRLAKKPAAPKFAIDPLHLAKIPTSSLNTTVDLSSKYFTTTEDSHGAPMVVNKTRTLIKDMHKSTELVYHGIRACARFLTYPTPSIPSDNYTFGQLKGWLWLLFKCFQHLKLEGEEKEVLTQISKEMSQLGEQIDMVVKQSKEFCDHLEFLLAYVDKQVKSMRKENFLWEERMDSYKRYKKTLERRKTSTLIDTREDRTFTSDWIFEPHPSTTKFEWDFFHIQWIKTKRDWITTEFEVRSDYSTKWTRYSSYERNLQVQFIIHLIQHMKAMIEECNTFIELNMKISFDLQEIQCLQFAVIQITEMRRNTELVASLSYLALRFFKDLILLYHVTSEFLQESIHLSKLIEPLYNVLNSRVEKRFKLNVPFEHSRTTKIEEKSSCGSCGVSKDFLTLYGEPMVAVQMRTPISLEVQKLFFPDDGKSILPLDSIPSAYSINAFGMSAGYQPSIFDVVIGRDPPKHIPVSLPKIKHYHRRRKEYTKFDLIAMVDHIEKCRPGAISIRSGVTASFDSKSLSPAPLIQNSIDMDQFMQANFYLSKLLMIFGSIFNFLIPELTATMDALDALIYQTGYSDKYDTLEKMIAYESSQDPKTLTGCKNFVKLYRMFNFLISCLEAIVELESTQSTSYVCKMAYSKTLAKYHSWFLQKRVYFSLYYLPTKGEIYSKIGSTFSSEPSPDVGTLLCEFTQISRKVIDVCEEILMENNLLDITVN